MSFLAPWMLALGAASALAVVALHLLSTRRPPAVLLPTARFVPESDVRAVARTSKPTDLLLLLLRALAVLLIGIGFAQPVPDAPGPSVRRVVAMEWTTSLADAEAVRAATRARLSDGDALVVFDTAARVLSVAELEQLPAPTVRRATMSPMFVAARDAAREIARGADSLGLVIISGFSADAFDAASAVLAESWPGRTERVSVAARADTAMAAAPLLIPADADDPLAPALAALPTARGAQALRIQRGALTAADSLWLADTPAGVLIHWPRRFTDSLRADGLLMMESDAAVLVAPFARLQLSSDAQRGVLARWRDGTPAVTERAQGAGCIRNVGIGLPEAGDLTLRTPFAHVMSALAAPCGGRREPALADSLLVTPSDTAPLAVASALRANASERSPATPWLLLAALLLLIAEQVLRRRQRAEPA